MCSILCKVIIAVQAATAQVGKSRKQTKERSVAEGDEEDNDFSSSAKKPRLEISPGTMGW